MPSVRPFSKSLPIGIVAATVWAALTLAGCSEMDTRGTIDQVLTSEAQNAEQNGDYEGAIHHYATMVENHHDDLVAIEGLARNLRHAGRLDDARRMLADALARLGPQPRLLLEKGKDEIGVGRGDLAVQTLQLAAAGAPTNWEPAATLAIAFDRLGRYDEAAIQYRLAMGLYPESADILNNYALSRALSGHIDDAVSLLRRAVAMPSASPQTRENLTLMEALQHQPAHSGRLTLPQPPLR